VGEVLYRAIGQVLLDMNLAQSVLGLDEVLVRYLPLDLDATNLLALRSGLLRDGLRGRHDFGRLGVRRDVLLLASLQLLLELIAAACSRNQTEEGRGRVEWPRAELGVGLQSDKVRVVWS